MSTSAGARGDGASHMRWAGPLLAAAALAAFGVAVVGGYRLGWTWTGFSDNTTVWDWLQLLVLPAVLTALPFWYRTRADRREWRIAAATVVAGSAAFVAAAYAFDWTWTGFPDEKLWDWLELLVLPVVLALLPVWLSARDALHPRWRPVAGAALAAFAVTVAGGYGLDWSWTGFQGNTLWDWLHLLLVPFLLPAGFAWMSLRLSEPPTADADAPPAGVISGD